MAVLYLRAVQNELEYGDTNILESGQRLQFVRPTETSTPMWKGSVLEAFMQMRLADVVTPL